MDYLKDPDAIYAESFRIIGEEADLSRFSEDEAEIATRLIHASGMIELAQDLVFAPKAVDRGRMALGAGAPVLCDVRMLQTGIIRRNLPMENDVLCGIGSDFAQTFAIASGTTRAAAGIESLADRMRGAVVAIGNAPTALFHLLEKLDAGWDRPALIVGLPVGFVGAEESKAELIANSRGVPFIALKGRRGGSALAAAVINALASGLK